MTTWVRTLADVREMFPDASEKKQMQILNEYHADMLMRCLDCEQTEGAASIQVQQHDGTWRCPLCGCEITDDQMGAQVKAQFRVLREARRDTS